jgi:uncharacterized protein YukE
MGKRGWIALVIALAVPGMAETAMAQEIGGDTARACQCQQQLVASLKTEVQAQSGAYEEKRRAFEVLDKEVQAARPRVDVRNQADIDAFKRLLDRRDAAADAFNGAANDSYTAAVKRYNDAVTDYNDNCTLATPSAQRRPLVCPKP